MIMLGDLLFRPLIEIARDLREKRTGARELIEAAIACHERFGERLHAYSQWAPQQARAVAEAADAAFAAGVTVGPLQGMPVSIKDLFAAAGYPCFAGSSVRLPEDPWERDGPLVARLRRQLGVIMGKTQMVEFAFGGTGQNSHWGAPTTRGTRPHTARSAVRRAAPASAYLRARRRSRSAATQRVRCAFPLP
jgi:aspartyl-tRNA(Asn)/glutamyl-tRNA(Gln) amidotransferase subunit A